jgi:hypothetical protein
VSGSRAAIAPGATRAAGIDADVEELQVASHDWIAGEA